MPQTAMMQQKVLLAPATKWRESLWKAEARAELNTKEKNKQR